MASQTEENYLKAMFSLTNHKNEGVNISELSRYLRVSQPTINSMVKNLKNQGLVNYSKYKPVSLTDKGKKEAALVLRKHRLTEMYLVNKMNFGWEEVHEIAEQIEHIYSPVFFDRMDELLGFPKFDPHGSPIPDKEGRVVTISDKKLSDCVEGEKVILLGLENSSTDFLLFLNSRELTLGSELLIKKIESFDKSITIAYKGHPSEVFSHVVCGSLIVEDLK